ncbi:MAG: LytR/AlgR family response regulator transcription factor [Velocimicrobium sp.]
MLSIYLCDDQKEQLQRLSKVIQNIITFEGLDMELAFASENPSELLRKIEHASKPSLYFLDIDLKTNMNGFDLAVEIRKVDPRGFIVFITTHDEMAPLSFRYKVEAMDYIVKEKVEEIPERLKECMLYALKQYTLPSNSVHKAIAMQVEDRIVMLTQSDIILIEPSLQAHKVTIYTMNSAIDITSTIKAIKAQLDDRFFQCSKSCVINRNRIAQIEKKKRILHMENGKECTISVRQMKELEKQLMESDIKK